MRKKFDFVSSLVSILFSNCFDFWCETKCQNRLLITVRGSKFQLPPSMGEQFGTAGTINDATFA